MSTEITKRVIPVLFGSIRQLPKTDNTLTKEGYCADAKAVGDILRNEQRAVNFSYDSNGNGLNATTIQGAIDEVVEKAILTDGGYGIIDKEHFKCMFGSNGSATHFYTDVRCHQSDTDKATLRLQTTNSDGRVALPDIIQLQDLRGGTLKQYRILGDHNKPTGSYTGNGSATARTINVGGIGGWLGVCSGSYIIGIITQNGAMFFNTTNSTVKCFPVAQAKYISGVLTISSADDLLNKNGSAYHYQVL